MADTFEGNVCFVPADKGELQFLFPTTPAAGALWDYVFPADYLYEILAWRYWVTNDANVALRLHFFSLQNSVGTEFYMAKVDAVRQPAGFIWRWNFCRGTYQQNMRPGGGSDLMVHFPNHLYVAGGYHMILDYELRQVGDQMNYWRMLVRRWRTVA